MHKEDLLKLNICKIFILRKEVKIMAIVHDEHGMNYASNGKANAALTTGIIGTSGFGLSLLNALGNGTGLLGGAAPKAVCSEDHFVNRYEAGQSARIAELETEIKLRDSNIYTDQKILDLYKYFDGENKQMRADFCAARAEQGIINANLMAGVDVLKSQGAETRALLNEITRVAVPQSSICNFGCGCNNGCSNI
jgi:hypothetical protein